MAADTHFVARSRIEASAEEVFQWHAEPSALERLTPPWEPVEVEQRAPGIRDGDRGILGVRIGPFRVRWIFQHYGYIEGRQFRDTQISGPFKQWDHTHKMMPDGPAACWLEDSVVYELPLGILGRVLGGWFVRRKLNKLFAYRHEATKKAMALRRPHASQDWALEKG
jgi:ligand-binding SRPBCC domain-containing protein